MVPVRALRRWVSPISGKSRREDMGVRCGIACGPDGQLADGCPDDRRGSAPGGGVPRKRKGAGSAPVPTGRPRGEAGAGNPERRGEGKRWCVTVNSGGGCISNKKNKIRKRGIAT